MAEHNEFGNLGEDIAIRYLESACYKILEKNWRYGSLEIDVIAMHGKELIIAEVKTRREGFLPAPGELVDKRKQSRIIRAANAYIYRSKLNADVRFDIILVIFNKKNGYKVDHIRNAFYPPVRS